MSSLRLLSLARAAVGRRLTARPGPYRLAYLSTTNKTTNGSDSQPSSAEGAASDKAVAAAAAAADAAADAAAEKPEFDAASSPSIAELADLIAEKDVKLAEVTDKYHRALAEMENVRLRSRRDVDNAYKYSIQGFAKDLLEVADNLNRALDNVDQGKLGSNPDLKTLYEGLQMTETGLSKVFEKFGIQKMEVGVGSEFDPNFHAAIFQEESADATPGTISTVVSKGYMFKDRVLRSAAVGTFKQAAAAASAPQSEVKTE